MVTARKKTTGYIVALRGGVVEIEFEQAPPPLHTLVFTADKRGIFEVVEKQATRIGRAITLSSVTEVKRGEQVFASGKKITVGLGRTILGRMFNLFGEPLDKRPFTAQQEVELFAHDLEEGLRSQLSSTSASTDSPSFRG